MDLSEFLLARIAADEAAARTAAEDGGPAVDVDALDAAGPILAAHVKRWGPGRVLAECETKRRMVQEYDWAYRTEYRAGLGVALRLLALPYTDHPDYQPEWKP